MQNAHHTIRCILSNVEKNNNPIDLSEYNDPLAPYVLKKTPIKQGKFK